MMSDPGASAPPGSLMSTTDAAHHHIDDQTPSDSLHTEQNTITGSTPTISPTYITEFTPADLDAQDVSANQAYSAAAAALPTDNGPPTSSPPLPTSHIQFRSHTIAPSPPLPQTLQLSCSQQPGGADESVPSAGSSSGYQPSPLGSNTLKIQTDVAAIAPAASLPSCPTRTDSLGSTISGLNPSSARTANSNNGTTSTSSTYTLQHKTSSSSLRPVSRTPSFKSALGPYYGGGTSIGTASATSSAVPSPIISALGDVTPLPSPLLSSDSPGPWKRLSGHQRPPSREMHPYGSPQQSHYAQQLSQPSIMMSESVVVSASESKHKAHGGLKATQGVELGGESKPQEDARGQVQRLSPKQMQQKKQQQPHGRNRSVSEYVPEPLPVLARRHATVSAGPHAAAQQQAVVAAVAGAGNAVTMRREPHLSEARGLTSSTAAAVAAAASAAVRSPPTPPPSESSLSATDGTAGSAISKQGTAATTAPGSVVSGKDAVAAAAPEYFEAYSREDPTRLRRWRAMRVLGQGTFSTVVLATSMPAPPTTVKIHEEDEEMADARDGHVNHTEHEEVMARALTPTSDGRGASGSGSGSGGIDGGKPTSSPTPTSSGPAVDRKTLVAVKICEHGPRGGASEDRIEMSLKRELDIMRAIRHPSLVHLKAWNIEPTRAILVLSYCPGGDLFDVASRHRDVLQHPSLLRRVFAELVGAVRYLHGMRIVHRDIKLENVLVNLTASELGDSRVDWQTYPYSVITLTDLGLSRRIADGERLETRCGSDDYAAPEVIMGQPYDGRATDAWSLGVLLYALLESRLPFDPYYPAGSNVIPGGIDAMRMRSRTSHRIARVEWRWIQYGLDPDVDVDDAAQDGTPNEHEADIAKFRRKGLEGAREITEALLRRARSRWSLDQVAATEWVRGGIRVDGGIRWREEEEGEVVG